MDGWTDGNGWMGEQMNGWVNEWMGGWVNECLNGWMAGWEWMDG